ncbi:hypothetical protein D9757_009096 [Collybiopsis confluens]|uniref:serine C-palmitoyltransferase n=1 Tax=Collybiopsis confluens TaxID=2823264 RepID=A0A8H5M2L3_9AGAR|nr:hypothetical protein D9757_009096 [Collybiopsis confluens]
MSFEKIDENSDFHDRHVQLAASDVDTGAQIASGGAGDVDPAEALRIRTLSGKSMRVQINSVQFMDKTTLGYAAIEGIIYNWCVTFHPQKTAAFREVILMLNGNRLGTIFYLSYLAFEFPQNLALQRFPVGKWMSINIFVWAVALCSHAACTSFGGLFAVRFILGICEGSITAGFMIVSAMFYTRKEQTQRVGYWFLMNGTAQIVLAFVAYGTLHITKSNLEPWQWFLTPRERVIAIQRIRGNQTGVENKHFKKEQLIEALWEPKTWLFFIFSIVDNIPNSLTNQGTLIISSFGFTPIQTTLLGCVSGVIEIVVIWSGVEIAARVPNSRAYVGCLYFIPSLLGVFLVNFLPWTNQVGLLWAVWLCTSQIMAFGASPFSLATHLRMPVIALAWVSSTVAGHTKKITMNTMMLVGYCIGNAVGPFMWQAKYKPRNHVPWIVIGVCYVVCSALMLIIRALFVAENRRRDSEEPDTTYDDVYVDLKGEDGVMEKVKVEKPAHAAHAAALCSSPTSSLFKKRPSSSTSPPTSAASYLSALSQADARARNAQRGSPTSTPALSLSSSFTSTTEDTVLAEEDDDNSDGLAIPVGKPPTSEQAYRTVHTEFGHCFNEDYRHISQHIQGQPIARHVDQDPPYYILLSTYISYLVLIVLGHLRDFVGKRFNSREYRHLMPRDGYAPLNSDFDSFYTRRLKQRMDECFAQPVTGVAGRTIKILDRYTPDLNRTQIILDSRTRALNISSYNYLGFASSRGGCADAVEEGMKRYGVSSAGSRLEGGSSDLHALTESLVAKFVGMESAVISSMGFATNSTFIPAMVSKGCLVISDELNHASIRFGVRSSGAQVRMFKHNDMKKLEALLREVISQGQPKSHRPWKKILIIVEGLYSMEGTMVDLPGLLALKEKYKFYLFVDEAHSIGAIGPHGRGVCDYFGVDPRKIDVLMGTFTKSFGASGGYIAGSKGFVDRLRVYSYTGAYAESISPPVLTQIIASMASIMSVDLSGVIPNSHSHSHSHSHSNGHKLGLHTSASSSVSTIQQETQYHHPGPIPQPYLPYWLSLPTSLSSGAEGQMRLRRLSFNSYYLHRGLDKLGFITYGHPSSPIVPLLIFNPAKMIMFHRMMKDRKTPIVCVVVAYPATPLITSRVRFCVSASHTKEDVDEVLRACDEIGDVLDLKHGAEKGKRWSLEEVCMRAVELVRIPDHER